MILLQRSDFIKMLDNEQYIKDCIPEPALYEQLAEECSELAQACLKKSRKLRGENFTPKTDEEINASILEEFTDVMLVSNTLKLHTDTELYFEKLQRWVDRNNV